MKKLLLSLSIMLAGLVAFSQGNPFPNFQPQGSPTTRWQQGGAVQAVKGIINGVYPDTATANLGYIDYYPGAQIFTTTDSSLWLRNTTATKWLRGAGSVDIDYFDFLNDSTLVICFSNGSCDTISMINFNTVVNNLIQNFLDSSVINIGDSILIICNAAGSCDTININGDTFNFYFNNDSLFAVTCDALDTICITGTSVGDSCYTQQVCDTTFIPTIPFLIFQNGLTKTGPIVEFGKTTPGGGAGQLFHDTYLETWAYGLNISGGRNGAPNLEVQQRQLVQQSSSIQSWNHLGKYPYDLLDANNPVNLYLNYTDPFAIPTQGALAGDTLGFMGEDYGYLLMTNSKGNNYRLAIDDEDAKQVGIFFSTYGTTTTAVSIFGNNFPSGYSFGNNPPTDSTLESAVIANFKTTGQVQLPQYLSGAFEDASPLYIIAQDNEGNLVQYPPGGISGGVLIDADNGLSVRSATTAVLGQNEAEVGNPAILLSNREVPMGGFYLTLNASATQAVNIFQTKNAAAAVRARITSAASFSNTGGQSTSEIFGDGATVGNIGSLAVGNGATASSLNSTALGRNAVAQTAAGATAVGNGATASGGVAIGITSTSPGNSSVAVGTSANVITDGGTAVGAGAISGGTSAAFGGAATANTTNGTALGYNAQANFDRAIAIGTNSIVRASGQFVAGQEAGAITDIYFGTGVIYSIPEAITFHGSGASGTNVNGAGITQAGGKGTGTGIGGDSKIQTAVPGSTGTTLQTLGDRVNVIGKYTTLTESSATSFVRVNVPTETVAGGEIIVTVEANDGTEFQARTLTFAWSAANKAGTTDADISTPVEVVSISSGTLTVTITVVDAGSGNIDFKADATSSLTQTVLRANCQVLKNFGTGAITAQ